ncbi:MAG TPA: hypothetical protein VHN37_11205 [Actinomycetota bacterium]|nr:hypothetical protein [Actinomycetota bacterium]
MFAAVLVAGLGVSPVSASARPRLAGSNTIRGASSASLAVVLPAPVVVPLDDSIRQIVDVVEDGRAAGFALVATAMHGDVVPTFGAVVLGSCVKSACASPKDERVGVVFWEGETNDEGTRLELPAGRYTLHLIADGAPVVARLALPGLRGSAEFRPRRPSPPSVRSLEATFDDGVASAVYSAGEPVTVEGRASFVAGFMRLHSDFYTQGMIGHCVYEGAPPAAPVGFAPGCPAGTNFLVTYGVVTPYPFTQMFLIGATFGQGEWGLGSWYAAGAKVTDVTYNLFEFETPALEGGTRGSGEGLEGRSFDVGVL